MTNSFSHNLKTLRAAKGLQQKDLAQSLGVLQSQIARWEMTDSAPRLTTIKKLAEVLEVRPTELADTPEVRALEMQMNRLKEEMKGKRRPMPGVDDFKKGDLSPPQLKGQGAAARSDIGGGARQARAEDLATALGWLDRSLQDAQRAFADGQRALTEARMARAEIQRLMEGK